MTSIYPLPESDWKFMRAIHDQMLDILCRRINSRLLDILRSGEGTAHERYLELCHHVREFDKIVADCFNDWRRSRMPDMLQALRFHRLLTDEHVARLSEEGRRFMRMFDERRGAPPE